MRIQSLALALLAIGATANAVSPAPGFGHPHDTPWRMYEQPAQGESEGVKGVLKRMPAVPGANFTLEAKPRQGIDTMLRIGIDPLGREDPRAEGIRWSERRHLRKLWNPFSVSATAQADHITVYLDVTQQQPFWPHGAVETVSLTTDATLTVPTQPTEERSWSGMVVVGAFESESFVKVGDSLRAVRVVGPSAKTGQALAVTGRVEVREGEPILVANNVRVTGRHHAAVRPVGMRLTALAAPDISGMLVTLYGRAESIAADHFVVTDGASSAIIFFGGLASGNTISPPNAGTRVKVTGFVSRATINGRNVRVVRPRAQFDITLNPPTTLFNLQLPAGISQFSLPLQPVEANPVKVLPSALVRGRLARWDAANSKWITFGSLTSEAFGGLQSFTGYYWSLPQSVNQTIVCYREDNDRWLPLPKAGTHLAPSGSADIAWAEVKFTDGNQMLSLGEAVAANWVNGSALYFDNATNTYKTLATTGGDDNVFRRGRAYWVTTRVPNLVMVIPFPQAQ